jgi:hypothetical protein
MSSVIATMGIVAVACCAARGARSPDACYVDLQADELGSKLGKLLWTALGEAELDDDIAALHQARVLKSLPKRLHPAKPHAPVDVAAADLEDLAVRLGA